MMKKLLVLCLVLGLCSLANAATFDWNNGAADGDWYNAANWTVTGGSTTYPTEGGAYGYYTNSDVGTINITDGSTVTVGVTGSSNSSLGTTAAGLLNITNGSTFAVGNHLWVADPESGVAFDINVDNATLTTGGYMDFGNGANSVVNVTVNNSVISAGTNLKFANHDGSNVTAVLTNSTITSGSTMYIGDAGGSADVTIDGGTLGVTGNMYVGDDLEATSVIKMTLTGGAVVNVSGYVTIPWDSDSVSSHLIVDDASLTVAGEIYFGKDGGGSTDAVVSRLFLSAGSVTADDLIFQATDSMIVYTGGQLLVNAANMSIADMTALIGVNIDVSGAPGYQITTIGDYTALIPEPMTMTLLGLGGLALIRRKRS